MSAKKKRQNHNHCCSSKQYYSNEKENLVKTLQITPRVIVYKESLKLRNDYEAKIHVVNKGLHKRRLLYSTDSPDTTIDISPVTMANDFLPAEESLNILVHITPRDKTRLQQRRHIYIDCKHPNIKFCIPIIILIKNEEVSIPPMITFPPTTVQNFAYYEMIIYNMSMYKLQYTVKSPPPVVVIPKKVNSISKKDYTKVLLKLDCQECQPVSGLMKLKLSTGSTYDIGFYHQPLAMSIFVDTLYISFDILNFNSSQTLEFTVCNESCNDMVYVFNFSTVEEVKLLKRITTADLVLPLDPITGERKEMIVKNQNKHFHFKPLCTTIPAFSSHIAEVTFKPILHKDFLPVPDLPPFEVQTGLCIRPKAHPESEAKYINLKGFITGIQIEISPKLIDMRRVYLGEEHCTQIEVHNLDVNCDAYVKFCGTTFPDVGKFQIQPIRGLLLKPQESGQFTIQFFSTEFGKFFVKLKFKVTNGGIYSVVIKGISQQARCKCFPEVVDLGNIPVALPQKRLALIRNPLTVPITVQLSVPEDGYEMPLVLNAHNVRDHLPINVNDPVYCLTQILENEYNEKSDDKEENIVQLEEDEEKDDLETDTSGESYLSLEEKCSSYSSAFEEFALDYIPKMSFDLLSYLKTHKVFDKHEIEKHVLDAALSELLETPYFFGMDEYKNYLQMDWNALATDPREIYCNSNEIIFLKPNAVRAVSIVVVPNVIGFHRKYIELRICPVMPKCLDEDEELDFKYIVESDKMTAKLWVKYSCEVPEIIWDNLVIMQDDLYAGQYYNFEMIFHNVSSIGGFFHYEVVPNCSLGAMSFTTNKWKFFIEPYYKLRVPCRVIFNKVGFITLSGLIKFVGVHAAYTFHIKAAVYSPKVKYTPRSIEQTINILQKYSMYVFIENATPTTTWFKLKVKDETVTWIEPLGAQLAPTGQIMYVTINVFYQDPGTYKNILYVIMEYETVEKIPITLHVKGMPLFFEPDICKNNLNVGYVLCNTEEDYNQDKPNFGKTIKVINKGLCDYHIIITRTKCTDKPTCHINFLKAKITIKPNNFVIQTMSEAYFTVFINCCEPCDIFNEFRIDIADVNDMQRAITYRFALQANCVLPQLNWNRRDIAMNYFRKHKYQEHDQWELVKLTNVTKTFLESVNLKLNGPFKIKELFEHPFEKELNFSMVGLETKQFFIMLDKPLIRDRANKYYEGRITCSANSRLQRSVHLKVLMYVPEIVVKYQQVTLFTKDVEGGTFIELKNAGDVPAIYKWKKLHEEWHYIQEEDDSEQVAKIVLSEIIRMLDIEPINLALDSETNLTRRYQKYKCYLKKIDDPINIKSIIYDIIDNLDLTVRRYKLCIDEMEKEWECFNIRERFRSMDKGTKKESNMEIQIGDALSLELNEDLSQEWLEEHFYSETFFMNRKFQTTSSTSELPDSQHLKDEGCAFYTLDYVINHLKLEDSYALSSPSSETCELVKSVYFFEKCGLLVENEKQYSAIHIPPIKSGHEVRAQFELDVIGGKSQLFELILVNLDKTVVLSKKNIYLGLKPWYETYNSKFNARNITNYQVSLSISKVQKPEMGLTKLASGYLNVIGDRKLHLPPYRSTTLKVKGILGLNEEFKNDLRIVVNGGEELTVKFNGHGVMPMLAICKPKLKFGYQSPREIMEEYFLLQKIYYFDIFKPITEKESDNLMGGDEEDTNYDECLNTVEEPSEEADSESRASRLKAAKSDDICILKILRTYVMIENNENLPNAIILYQLLQTEKFVNYLRANKDLSSFLGLVYQNYLMHQKSYDAKMPTNLKHFTIQPLPFYMTPLILDMGQMYFNQYRKFVLVLEFLGPGKLIAACRSIVKIPSLIVDFGITENTGNKDFVFYRCDEKLLDSNDEPYRNMYERRLDAEKDPKVKHAHSYDFTRRLQHQREITPKDPKWRSYYDSLNKSIYTEQKHHIISCKIRSNCNYNFSGTKITLTLLFKPRRANYKPKQKIEDYLYIDVHMGPTLPILLQGVISLGNGSESTTQTSQWT